MKRTYKFKLYRSKKNRLLHQRIFLAAQVYNHCLALQRRYYRLTKKYLNLYRLQAFVAKLKKRAKFQHWKELGSQAIQDVIERLDKGYQLFFSERAKGNKKIRPPKFKKSRDYRSFTLKQSGYKYLGDNRVQIGKRNYGFFGFREIDGTIKRLTISRDSLGDLFICFSCDVKNDASESLVTTGQTAGFDLGLKTFLTSSDGKEWVAPQPLKTALKELKTADRSLSSKVRGSQNWKRAKKHLARVHRRITNVRQDFQWKLARELVETYDELYFETLAFEGFKARWGRKTSDLAFASFLSKVDYLADMTGSNQ